MRGPCCRRDGRNEGGIERDIKGSVSCKMTPILIANLPKTLLFHSQICTYVLDLKVQSLWRNNPRSYLARIFLILRFACKNACFRLDWPPIFEKLAKTPNNCGRSTVVHSTVVPRIYVTFFMKIKMGPGSYLVCHRTTSFWSAIWFWTTVERTTVERMTVVRAPSSRLGFSLISQKWEVYIKPRTCIFVNEITKFWSNL